MLWLFPPAILKVDVQKKNLNNLHTIHMLYVRWTLFSKEDLKELPRYFLPSFACQGKNSITLSCCMGCFSLRSNGVCECSLWTQEKSWIYSNNNKPTLSPALLSPCATTSRCPASSLSVVQLSTTAPIFTQVKLLNHCSAHYLFSPKEIFFFFFNSSTDLLSITSMYNPRHGIERFERILYSVTYEYLPVVIDCKKCWKGREKAWLCLCELNLNVGKWVCICVGFFACVLLHASVCFSRRYRTQLSVLWWTVGVMRVKMAALISQRPGQPCWCLDHVNFETWNSNNLLKNIFEWWSSFQLASS